MATEFCVLENDRPACYPQKTDWSIWKYRTYEEAFQYLKLWLGVYGNGVLPNTVPLGKKFYYNGGYDYVSIVEINNPQ